MKVTLLSIPNNMEHLIYTACKTCTSDRSCEDIFSEPFSPIVANSTERKHKLTLDLIKNVLDSGHHSVLEHIHLVFAVDEVSRSCTHQLVRHRHASFSQQSLRYVEIVEDLEYLNYLVINQRDIELESLANKYFVSPYDRDVQTNLYNEYVLGTCSGLLNYLHLKMLGSKSEDARNVLGMGIKSNIVVSCNLRSLIHIANVRLCNRAQKEIRDVVGEMCKLVTNEVQWLDKYLVPKCRKLGYCDEVKACGMMPTKEGD